MGMIIASFWNKKALQWLNGRKGLFTSLKINNQAANDTVWMHCASLGEFEQGRPLLEKLKKDRPGIKIVLTFFSPSGYQIMKNYKLADIVSYLPLDNAENAAKFINVIRPNIVLWVKYEFWYHFLKELHNKKIPILLISGIFRKDQLFFQFYGVFWRKLLDNFYHFFVQDNSSRDLLITLGKNNISISGDTRFDRVLAISNQAIQIPYIEEFCLSRNILVAGSTWEEDELLLVHYIRANPHVGLIIAPHEIYSENLEQLKRKFSNSVLYSEWVKIQEQKKFTNELNTAIKNNCLIIDNIGMLSGLYKYADVCYVGGGFGADGVHNVLEPAVYGKPVLFGPEYEKYIEAGELLESGGAIEVKNAIDLEQTLDSLFNNVNKRNKWGIASRDYVVRKTGATDRIIEFIYKNRLLTS